ncbi:MAG: hypothetical protein CL566_03560 [Alphaproteobacteria bacterium]|nr:hypothetical protein [Alphaproteobacteria bacterium]
MRSGHRLELLAESDEEIDARGCSHQDNLIARKEDLVVESEPEIGRRTPGMVGHIGLACVAEWVESEDEAKLLRDEGVDLLQSWHCSKPEVDPDWMD